MDEKPGKTQTTTSPEAKTSDNGLVRLNRYLAMAGIGSRRTCDSYILEGRIKVNGEVVDRLGTRINPDSDTIEFDGELIADTQELVYLLLNKPLRTVTTVKDEKKRRTVIDIIGASQRLFPVGRLDYNTSGALMITNDGEMAYFLIHPRFQVKKLYRVMLNKVIRPIDLHNFQKGIDLDGRMTAPCRAREMRRVGNRSYLEVELHEGRNRQIRRMFEILGYNVEQLHRHTFAGLTVQDMNEGEWRELSRKEVDRLKKMVEEQKDKVLDSEK